MCLDGIGSSSILNWFQSSLTWIVNYNQNLFWLFLYLLEKNDSNKKKDCLKWLQRFDDHLTENSLSLPRTLTHTTRTWRDFVHLFTASRTSTSLVVNPNDRVLVTYYLLQHLLSYNLHWTGKIKVIYGLILRSFSFLLTYRQQFLHNTLLPINGAFYEYSNK